MYRVVIIDDEPIIVRGLSQMLPWEKYNCQVVGTAMDGLEGMGLIRSLQPHIVFSDIYMPKMDGLTMAAAMKSEFEDMELTVLTGYRDFELAQEAIRLGVARFLLKPSNMEELEEAVETMVRHLKRKGITGQEPEDNKAPVDTAGRAAEDTAEEVPEGETQDGEEPGEGNLAGSFVVNKALDYMRKNYQRKVTLTDVAYNTYVSQWHLSKLLNRHTGQSFSELMNSIRIEEAKKLLGDPALRIGDVAEAVGFLDMAHFSRVFKKITGVSANEYRNRMK